MTDIQMTTTRTDITRATALINVPFAIAGSFYRRLVEAARIRRDLRMLQHMSDHELRDIGLDRGHIGYAIRHGRLD